MRWRLGMSLSLCAACGPTTGGPLSAGGGGGAGDDDGSGGLGVSTTSAGEGTSARTDTGVADGGTTDSGSDAESDGAIEACGLALPLDECCHQPIPATAAEVMADDCLVPWPYDDAALPDGLFRTCLALQPEFCAFVDCDISAPASEVVALNDEGECVSVCPEMTSLAYQQAHCYPPPPVARCLPPAPPCAMDYCTCAGETVSGCGQLPEPFAHEGPCK